MLQIGHERTTLTASHTEFIKFLQYLSFINVYYRGYASFIEHDSVTVSNNRYINYIETFHSIENNTEPNIAFNLRPETIPYVEEFNRLYND